MKLTNLIKIEFRRWESVKVANYQGHTYRVSKFSPEGKLAGYSVAVRDGNDWLPCETCMDLFESADAADRAIRGLLRVWSKQTKAGAK